MYYVVYISTAARLMTDEDLIEILIKSRNNNFRLGITGVLLYHEGTFIQAIEGDKVVIDKLLNSICKDKRHFGLTIITEGIMETHAFPDWSMGFLSVDAETLSIIRGYKRLETIDAIGNEAARNQNHEALLFIKSFAQNNYPHAINQALQAR
ncbi:BLUF domain-containing protein [Mucilaginibacter paludis]|uniref:BLUF domain protein n=1 Tax=Mucilaginibacter paludis DSM 18603 TaxID=714943 RepID=H1YF64_9SPHI|nr:BLUF domain-containing protein [Mucilaginibacter paludis]EHQ26203.1 BLUF domain protein [Mucilaginibacter paludis DSM 18603]